MKVQESLTKDNFWNELTKSYPLGTKVFYDWIDEYKKAVNWQDLFRDHLNADAKFSSPKFHNLPHAMQLGIWIFFLDEIGIIYYYDDLADSGLKEHITQTMKLIEIDNMP